MMFLKPTDIFLLISLLENPSPIICSRLESADFRLIVEEVVARSVPFSVLSGGPILRHKEVSFLLIKKRGLVRTELASAPQPLFIESGG